MKLLFDLFPVILFFATYKLAGGSSDDSSCIASAAADPSGIAGSPILLATVVAILATFAQVGWLMLRKRKVDKLLWVSLGIITVFGGATLYFRDPGFIQWKPTILYWLFACALLLTQALGGKNLIRSAMESQIALPDPIWARLNVAWGVFFALLGVANLAAAKHFSCNGWVSFKLYGLTGIMFVFMLAQGMMLSKYIEVPEDKA